MKSKKFFLLALAVLMLVAFTACEQSVPSLSKAVIAADIRQTGTFFVGQPFDASKFVVDVTYSDKTTATLSGVNVIPATSYTDSNGVTNGMEVSVTLPVAAPGYNNQGTASTDSATFKGSLVAYKFTSLTITGTESLPYDTTNVKFVGDVEITSVIGNYKDSTGASQQYTFRSDEYTVEDPVIVEAPTEEAIGEASVTVKPDFGGLENGEVYHFEATYYEAPAEPVEEWTWNGQIVAKVVEESAETGAYVQRGVFAADKMIEVYKVEVNSLTGETRDDETKVTAAEGETLDIVLAAPLAVDNDEIRFGETSTNTVNVTYTYIDNETTGHLSTATASATINTRADYLTSIGTSTVVWNGSAYDAGASIPVSDFALSLTWRSGYEDDEIPTSMIRVEPSIAPSLETQDTDFAVKISYANQSYADCADTVSSVITVNADPDFKG